MESETFNDQRLLRMEHLLAGLLRYGAIVACAWIAAGMGLSFLEAYVDSGPLVSPRLDSQLMAIGTLLLIALPVLRVGVTALIFLYERDYVFLIISSTVLIIIACGFFLGLAAL